MLESNIDIVGHSCRRETKIGVIHRVCGMQLDTMTHSSTQETKKPSIHHTSYEHLTLKQYIDINNVEMGAMKGARQPWPNLPPHASSSQATRSGSVKEVCS